MSARPRRTASMQARIAGLDPNQREIVETLRALVKKADPKATESYKWNMPVFEDAGMLCYIWPLKRSVNFGFYNASPELADPNGLLEGTGKKMRHVKLESVSDVKPALFTKWVKRAAEFNRSGMRASGAGKKESTAGRRINARANTRANMRSKRSSAVRTKVAGKR